MDNSDTKLVVMKTLTRAAFALILGTALLAVLALVVWGKEIYQSRSISPGDILQEKIDNAFQDRETFEAFGQTVSRLTTASVDSSAVIRSELSWRAGRLSQALPQLILLAVERRFYGDKTRWDTVLTIPIESQETFVQLGGSSLSPDSIRAYYSERDRFEISGSGALAVSQAHKTNSGIFRVYSYFVPADSSEREAEAEIRCVLYFYYPMEGGLWYSFNLVFLSIILFFLLIQAIELVRRSKRVPYLWPLMAGLFIMVIVFTIRTLSTLAAIFSIPMSESLVTLTNLLFNVLPDAPCFMWAGILLIASKRDLQWKMPPQTLIVIFLVFYLFTILNVWTEWPSVTYSFLSIFTIGVGLYLRCRELGRGEQTQWFSFFRHVAPMVFILFTLWSLSQFGYILRDRLPIFAIVFVTKSLALTGLVLYQAIVSYGENVMERDEFRRESLEEIGRRSLDIILAVNDQKRVEWYSAPASSLLNLNEKNMPLKKLIRDAFEYEWLERCVIDSRRKLHNVEITFRSKDDRSLICQADFIPNEGIYAHDLVIARPVEWVMMVAVHKRFHIHGLQGTVNTCKSWLQQLVDWANGNIGTIPESLESLRELRANLDALSGGISPASEVTVDLGLQEPNRCDLKKVLEVITEEDRKGVTWNHLRTRIEVPKTKHLVRAKETLLLMMLSEFLNNANKKMSNLGTESFADISLTVEVPNTESGSTEKGDSLVSIKVIDTGPPFPEENLEKFKRRHHILSPGDKGSLERVRFFAELFGGDLTIENRSIDEDGTRSIRPAVTLRLWSLEEENGIGQSRASAISTSVSDRRSAE